MLTEAFLQPCRTSSRELFSAKIRNGFKLLTIFEKKLRRRCSTGLKIEVWLRVWNIELTLVPSLWIKPRKYSVGKFCFWKNKRSWWDSKQNECLRGSSRLKGCFTKLCYEKFRRIHKKISVPKSLLLTQVIISPSYWLCRSAASLKTSL